MLTRRDRILVGVSGGADSTALVLALRELGYHVAIGHLNHGLRGAESNEDEQTVKELARDLDIACFTQSASIRTDQGKDRKSVEWGKRLAGRVDPGGRRTI